MTSSPLRTSVQRVVKSRPGSPRRTDTIDNYQGATRYLADRINFEKVVPTRARRDEYKLDRIRALLDKLGNPHDAIRTVHVAGTKGKGSTCEMAASCLRACGYTVGLYTSPHLIDARERVRINGRMISHADFTVHTARIAAAGRKIERDMGRLTYFEVMTALGMLHFAEQAVDIAVIETGLGGRLDCTNVITPEVTAITAIDLDHTQILGDTIEQIALEKAGIFKPGVPALSIAQPTEVLDVLRRRAGEVSAPFFVLGTDIDFSMRFESAAKIGPHTRVCLSSDRNNFEHFVVPLMGHHQGHNCGLALAILDKLCERGFETPAELVNDGLESTSLPARAEIAWPSPRIMLDGAHNPSSLRALFTTIGQHVPYDSLVVVFGCGSDKDVPGMLAELDRGADKVIFTRAAGNPRAVDPHELARMFEEASGKMCQVEATLKDAINAAHAAVSSEDLIAVTGSFFLAGEAKKLLSHAAGRKGA